MKLIQDLSIKEPMEGKRYFFTVECLNSLNESQCLAVHCHTPDLRSGIGNGTGHETERCSKTHTGRQDGDLKRRTRYGRKPS